MRRRTATLAALLLAACGAAPELLPTSGLDVTFTGTAELGFRLRRVIEDQLLDFEREPANEAPLFDAALDLQDHFVDRGHPDARVTYRLRREGRLAVVFAIEAGPEVTVRQVHFTGNDAVRGDDLRALWTRTRSGSLGLGDPLFVKSDLDALRLAALDFYDSKGFLDATVQGPAIDRAPGGRVASIDYQIVEGPQYHFGSVTLAPDLPLDGKQLGVDALPGRVFDRAAAAALRLRARNALLHTGYPDPRLELDTTIDRTASTVSLLLHGQAGPRATVAAVSIVGNDRTADFVIERHIHVEPGTLYDGAAVERTTSELYQTGLFRRVEVEQRPRDGNGDAIDLAVRVDEIDAHELDLLAGYGSYETLRGGVSWTDRNLFGLGQRLQVGVRASIRGEALTSSWVEPHLFGSDTSLSAGGNLRERQEPAFVDASRGAEAALARDLIGPLRGRLGYSLTSRDGRDIDPTIGAPTDSRYEIGSLFAELLIDRRDSPLYPGRGHRLSLKLERAGQGVGGNVDLDRVTGSAAWFHTIAQDLVLGASWRTGVIWVHGGDVIPLQERFFNGGESTVRSFREAQLGPQSTNGTPIGGAWFTTTNVELRFPLVGTLHGAVFADAGNVDVDADTFGLDRLRYALGGGLRLVLPIGPVRLDGAINPDRQPGEDAFVLHFSVGLPF